MCRGVFAMTWFLLLGTSLINLYAAYSHMIDIELEGQGTLMDAEEAFYGARNFEFEFMRAVAENELERFHERWPGLIYGYFQEFPEKECIQTQETFSEFMSRALSRSEPVLFSPIGGKQTCLTHETNYGKFKTRGVIKSTVCINTSSPLFLC